MLPTNQNNKMTMRQDTEKASQIQKHPRDVSDISWATGKFFFFSCFLLFLLTKLILTTDNNNRDGTKQMTGITGRVRVAGKDSTKNRKANDQHHHCEPLLARWITGAQ
jgi:hypothetical protein